MFQGKTKKKMSKQKNLEKECHDDKRAKQSLKGKLMHHLSQLKDREVKTSCQCLNNLIITFLTTDSLVFVFFLLTILPHLTVSKKASQPY